jgi:toxin-antitoxin system PIN domain toxin
MSFRRDAPHHSLCKAWLETVVQGDARFGVSPLALGAVVHIASHPRIYAKPSPVSDIFEFCDSLLGMPNCQVVEPGKSHWRIFEGLCLETGTRGSKVTDIWYAALAIEWGCTWITFDRDFARFPGLSWRQPEA